MNNYCYLLLLNILIMIVIIIINTICCYLILVYICYLILSISPKLTSKKPKSGPGSLQIKQVMAMFLLAAAVWFLGIGISQIT